MKSTRKSKVGLFVLTSIICLNVIHAVNNYGIIECNNLHWKVAGQIINASYSNSNEEGGSNAGEKNPDCPPSICIAGGCGSSSCKISQTLVGASETIETSAHEGYFACCYKNSFGSWFAQTFKMDDCCK